MIPAGMFPYDDRVEIYACEINNDHAYCMIAGAAVRVANAPQAIKDSILANLQLFPDKDLKLQREGYIELDAKLEKYARCMSGACDGDADIVGGVFLNVEHWLCPTRFSCTMQICNRLVVGVNNEPLTRTETEHLLLISKGLYNKEIADQMDVSPETLKIHHKRIYKKTGLNNKAELTLLSFKKNLIS